MDALTHTAFAAKRVAVPHTGGVSGGDVLKYQNGFNFFTDFGKKLIDDEMRPFCALR